MTDKCEYEPVDTGDGKKKVNPKKIFDDKLSSFYCNCFLIVILLKRLRKWKKKNKLD